MRITSKMIFSQIDTNLIKTQGDLLAAHDKVVTGKKILNPSDDPAAVNKILSYRTLTSNIEQYNRNLNAVQGRLEATESALDSTSNILQRLKELATAQANGTMNADDREVGAREAEQLFEEMVGIGNTKTESGYLFAGYDSDTVPFNSDGSVNATDISGEINIQIDSGMTITANIPGDKLFKGESGGIDIFTVVNTFITALNSNDTAGIQTAISDMDSALNQVIDTRTDVGTRLSRIDLVRERLDDVKLITTKALSQEEDIDIAEAISDFTARQQALEAARASASRIFEMPTLMDFLK